ncbi:MAG: hypothetical protein ABW153_19810 [Sedimenticola sp.]
MKITKAPTEEKRITGKPESVPLPGDIPYKLPLAAVVMLLCAIAILLLEYLFIPRGLSGWE